MHPHNTAAFTDLHAASRPVLVADDDDALRALVVRMLSRAGYQVREATDGSEVVELLRDRHPRGEILLLDVHMPGLSGIDILATLRSAGDRAPVVLMTGASTPELRDLARHWGAAALIDKPFSPDTLANALLDADRLTAEALAETSLAAILRRA